jgi:hypothetical protein
LLADAQPRNNAEPIAANAMLNETGFMCRTLNGPARWRKTEAAVS